MKCKHCGRIKMKHNAMTKACPVGRRSRAGFIHYSNRTSYEEEKMARRSVVRPKDGHPMTPLPKPPAQADGGDK